MCVTAGAGEWLGGTATTGVAEYGWLYGLSGAWYTIANGIGICFLAVFFARLFRSFNISTIPGIIGKYLGEKAKMASAALLIFVTVAIGSSQMVAIGTLSEELFHINAIAAIAVLGLGILLYTSLGGMPAVGYTNVMHVVVMYAGSILSVILCLRDVGGMTSLRNTLPDTYFSMGSIGMTKISSWLIASILGACVAQAGIQPVLASKDTKTAVRSSYLIAIIVIPFGLLSALLGMIAHVKFPDLENAKLALPALLMSMNPVTGGFVMASVMAAILSTASPIFLACGTLFSRDIYSTRKQLADCETDDRQILWVPRCASFTLGCVCILLAVFFYDSQRLLDIVYFAYSIRGSLFIILLLSIYWKKTSSHIAVLAMGATCIVGLIWIIYKNIVGQYPIFPQFSETYAAVLTSTAVTVFGSIIFGHINKRHEGRS
ncbi:MAG: sodium:solute symporter family protein [Bacteroides fragilis]|nr:sodium:solute symporter family protein [Bacteroides fragilis]